MENYLIYTSQNTNTSDSLMINHDVNQLDKKIREYMATYYSNVVYLDFYDKKFLDVMKSVIKLPNTFDKFLKFIKCDIELFIHSAVYICPKVFTTSIIKFINLNYI